MSGSDSDTELVVQAIFSALQVPQEIVCVDAAAAAKLRFAIYGLRRGLAEQNPKVMDLVVKVRGTTVVLEMPVAKILSIRPVLGK